MLLVHLPERLCRVRAFDGPEIDFGDYVDVEGTVADVEAGLGGALGDAFGLVTTLLRDHADARHPFRVALSPSGPTLRCARRHEGLRTALAALNTAGGEGVEWIAEPFDRSILSVLPGDHVTRQWRLGADEIERQFGVRPTSGANTELIYDDTVATRAAAAGLNLVLCGMANSNLNGRSANRPYRDASGAMTVLARNTALSDDLGVRLGDESWACHPLSAKTFADWVANALEQSGGSVCPIYLHLADVAREAGLRALLKALPGELASRGVAFALPRQYAGTGEDTLHVPQATSAVEPTHDLRLWLGNAMQSNVMSLLSRAAAAVGGGGGDDTTAATAFGTLAACDLLAATRFRIDRAAETPRQALVERSRRPSPYESPYDAYLDHTNALRHFLRTRGVMTH